MKREIDCKPCGERWKDVPAYPAEHVRVVPGILFKTCRCDGCGEILPFDTAAVAVTVWTDDQHPKGAPLWEDEFFLGAD